MNTNHEQRARISSLRKTFRRLHCDALLIQDMVDVRYLTGFNASFAALLLTTHRAILFTDFRYQQAAEKFSRQNPHIKISITGNVSKPFLRKHIATMHRVGFQADYCSFNDYQKLSKDYPWIAWHPFSSSELEIGIHKSQAEIAKMRRAARIGETALQTTIEALREGVTEIEVKNILEAECQRHGSTQPSFPTIVLFGKHSALPHGVAGRNRLRNKSFVLFDFGCTVDGFCSDMTRTFFFGIPGKKQRNIYDTVLRAQTEGVQQIRSGMTTAEADATTRQIIDGSGYAGYFGHATGHGVGYRIHEEPRLSATSKQLLSCGMVVTVEPGIYIPSIGGVRIEDMVVIKEKKSTCLTRFSKDFTQL